MDSAVVDYIMAIYGNIMSVLFAFLLHGETMGIEAGQLILFTIALNKAILG